MSERRRPPRQVRGMAAVWAAVVAALALSPAAAPAQYTWKGTVNGRWADAANWDPTGGPPNSSGATATFGSSFNTAVTIDAPIVVGSITYAGSFYTLALGGVGSLTLDNAATNAVIAQGAGASSATVSANLTVASNNNLNLS